MDKQTAIYKQTAYGERMLGLLAQDGTLLKQEGRETSVVGRVADNKILRKTMYDERELGSFTREGQVHSHGLFEGGAIGWVDPDGVVVQAGLILGEEEVGRVEGPDPQAAAAALLLLFLPDEAAAEKEFKRKV
ncbi:MAG: hypothetical protein U0175_37845 [Caldilineaceae bacterium]